MESGVLWAILAALSSALLFVFEKQAASKIDSLFGSLIVSITGVFLGILLLIPKYEQTILIQNKISLLFLILAGICALAIDYFTLKTYNSCLPISIGGSIIIGGSITLTAIIGIILGEGLSLIKTIGILLVLGGALLLVV